MVLKSESRFDGDDRLINQWQGDTLKFNYQCFVDEPFLGAGGVFETWVGAGVENSFPDGMIERFNERQISVQTAVIDDDVWGCQALASGWASNAGRRKPGCRQSG